MKVRRQPAPFDPSKPLRRTRKGGDRERFCQEMLAGAALREAYASAGYTVSQCNARRLEQTKEVAARLAYLQGQVAEVEETLVAYRRISTRRLLEDMILVDRADMFEEIEVERKVGRGKSAKIIKVRALQLKPLEALTLEQRKLFEGIGDAGRPIMPAKLVALAQLARLDGLDKPFKQEFTGKDGTPLTPTINLYGKPDPP